jgi:hypothetical protein
MQVSTAQPTRSSLLAGHAGPAVGLLFLTVVFGVVWIGPMPKWPIYVTILMWWSFVLYTTLHNKPSKPDIS